MSKFDIMKNMTESNNGYFFVAEAVERGISKTYAESYIKKSELKKVAKGIYISEDAWEDFLYILSKKYKSVVFSHQTALDIHGLMDCKACKTVVTVNRTYNASSLRNMGCTVYAVTPDVHEAGIITANDFWGNEVPVYDLDRTICDIIKHKDRIMFQTYQYAIKNYMNSPQKNLDNLLKYAKLLKVEETVKNYLDVLI